MLPVPPAAELPATQSVLCLLQSLEARAGIVTERWPAGAVLESLRSRLESVC